MLKTIQLSIFLLFCLIQNQSLAQEKYIRRVALAYTVDKHHPRIGDTLEVVLEAYIYPKWQLYASENMLSPGPQSARVHFNAHASFVAVGNLKSIQPKVEYDVFWKGYVRYFLNKARFKQKVKILQKHAVIEGKITYQLCSIVDKTCIVESDSFRIVLP